MRLHNDKFYSAQNYGHLFYFMRRRTSVRPISLTELSKLSGFSREFLELIAEMMSDYEIQIPFRVQRGVGRRAECRALTCISRKGLLNGIGNRAEFRNQRRRYE